MKPRPLPAPDASSDLVTATWPEVNTLISISAEGWPERISRVEDRDATRIAIAAPRGGKGELEAPETGAAFDLRWAVPRGLRVLPVRLVERVRGQVDVWWVEPSGQAALSQRREFVRAPVVGWPVRVRLTWELPEEDTAVGDLLDLSEGGLRATMRGWRARPGAAVAVLLTVATGIDDGPAGKPASSAPSSSGVSVTEFELMGTVLRATWPQALPGGGPVDPDDVDVEVVVQLHHELHEGDRLRSLVFAWQRRARHA